MITQIILSGALTGLLYALIAFGFQLTYATSKTANFGQGALVMLGGLISALITPLYGYWIALPVVLITCATVGFITEYLCIKPSLSNPETNSSWIVSTIALGMMLIGAQELFFGTDELAVATPLPDQPWSFHGIYTMPHELFIAVIVILITLGLELFYRSRYGKTFEAVAQDTYAAELQGIHAEHIVLGSYIVSSMLAGLAGWMISPITGAGLALDLLGIKGFCAAVVGSLSSSRGALLAGVLIGVIENLTVLVLPSGYRALPPLILCALIITFRPTGLFGTTLIKKV